jgi:hypothetical protein
MQSLQRQQFKAGAFKRSEKYVWMQQLKCALNGLLVVLIHLACAVLCCRCLAQRAVVRPSRTACVVYASVTQTKTVKIGTRGSPLALAQAYLTRDLLKVGAAVVPVPAGDIGAFLMPGSNSTCYLEVIMDN